MCGVTEFSSAFGVQHSVIQTLNSCLKPPYSLCLLRTSLYIHQMMGCRKNGGDARVVAGEQRKTKVGWRGTVNNTLKNNR